VRRLAGRNLRSFNSFGVEAQAAAVIELDRDDDLGSIVFDPDRDLLLGGGSNVLLAGDIDGTAYLARLRGRRILDRDRETALVEAAAGEDWHGFVSWTLDQGLCGLENLSLIPGSVGAAPIQNIGAYGVELSERLESLRAWDWQSGRWREFDREACRFAYRDSRFKSIEPDRYLVHTVRLRLDLKFQPRLAYAGIQDELRLMGIDQPTASDVSRAVIAIRRRKLPDPSRLGNAGSFFKNPTLPGDAARALEERHPGLPFHPLQGDRYKLSAAWLIEASGWKGHRRGDAAVSARHALVLVNHGGASGRELLDLAMDIRDSVQEAFDIELEIEPRVVPKP
jgi:UDP-N-acetylmuramate dehydrogenase